MTEKKSKIVSSTFSSTWKNAEGKLCYYYDLTLEDGEYGSVGVMQKDSPKVSVGTEIIYYKENSRKIKIVKVVNGDTETNTSYQKDSKGYRKPPSSHDSHLGFAWSYAKDLIIAGKTMKDVDELNKVARFIYGEIGKMINNE